MFCQCKSLSSVSRSSWRKVLSWAPEKWQARALYLSQFWNWKLLGLNLYWNWNKIWFPTRKYFHPKFDSLQSWVHEKWRKRFSVRILLIWHLFYLSLRVQNCGGPDSFSLRLIVCMSSYAGNCTANRGPINLHLGPQSGTQTSRLWLFWIKPKSPSKEILVALENLVLTDAIFCL